MRKLAMDNLTKKQRQKNMQNIHSEGTLPERIVMRELQKMNIYFAKYVTSITGKPDIVFRKKKVAVFVDSDFWHGHPARYIKPKTNIAYWKAKVERNKKRDREVNKILRNKGWKVLRVWEHDIKASCETCVKKIIKELG
jgi:DNA mismatch endonuclease (patch repair protein)